MVDGLPLPAGFPLGSQGQNSEKSETPLRLGKNPEQVRPLPPPPPPNLWICFKGGGWFSAGQGVEGGSTQ